MKYLMLLVLLSGCATRDFVAVSKAPELTPYVTMFEETYGVRFNGNYFFDDLDDGILGEGGYSPKRGKFFVVDFNEWHDLMESQKIILVFHELVHANWGHYKHTDGEVLLNDRLCPSSIMNTYMESGVCFEQNQEYYLNELKNHFHSARE